MNSKYKSVPNDWHMVMDSETIARAVSRMSFEIESQNAFALRVKAITLTTSRRRSIQILKWRSINFAAKHQLPRTLKGD